MTEPHVVIKELAETSSKNEKQEILRREAREGNTDFFVGLRIALDPLLPFYVKKIPQKKNFSRSLDFNHFALAASNLSSRAVTGNDAIELVHDLMDSAGLDEWNDWYRRILLKDLKAGISEKTVNKVLDEEGLDDLKVPVFGGCQLAHDGEKHQKKLKGKKQVEVKLDGVRALVFVRNRRHGISVDIFSRNGKKFENFKHIENQIIAAHEAIGMTSFHDYIIDGEIMSSNFQDLMKQVYRKKDVNATDAVLHAFDIIDYLDWMYGGTDTPQYKRSSVLAKWYNDLQSHLQNVSVLDYEVIDLDTTEGSDRLKQLNKFALENGYEGIILKDVHARYVNDRSHAWLKMKPVIEVTLTIDEVVEGEGRNEGRLGAFHCSGVDDGIEISTSVGSGFSDRNREDYYTNDVVGSMIEVRADAVTQNADLTYSLRFPRFVRFRDMSDGVKT